MSQLQVQHKTAFVNGGNRRRGDQDLGSYTENFRKEYQNSRASRSGTGNQSRMEGGTHQYVTQTSSISKVKAEALTRGESRGESQQHLHCLTACLTGQAVEVQVKCGSIYSGVFHSGNAEKDHGIVLKMARLIKDVSSKGKCDITPIRPQKRFLINMKDLVQIIAKDVPLGREPLQNGRVHENGAEMVTDSVLSHGKHGDLERELKPWTPDTDDSKDLELESTFENTWNRNWDQFEINKALFGVESTFNEDLYTTKLEKGPQMREREKEAWRIAREIEEQSAKHLHLADVIPEGKMSSKDIELLDEESRFSSVLRSSEDVGEDNEDVIMVANNGETSMKLQNNALGGQHSLMKARDNNSKKTSRPSSADLKKDSIVAPVDIRVAAAESLENTHKEKSPHAVVGDRSNKQSVRIGGAASPRPSSLIGDATGLQALNLDPGSPHVTEDVYRDFNEFRQQENAKRGRQLREEQVNELKSFSKTLKELRVIKQQTTATTGNTHKSAAVCAPPASALPLPTSITNPVSTVVGLNSGGGPGPLPLSQPTPLSRAFDSTRAVAGEGVSTSDLPQLEQPSMNALCIDTPISPMNSTTSAAVPSSPSSTDVSSCTSFSKKSTLNPHAKEFKLNPNAKSFTPNFTPLRPPSPVIQGSINVPGMLPPGPPMQGVPMGVAENPQIPQSGQPAAKYSSYNSMGVAGSSGGAPFLPSPGTYTSGTPLPPPLGGGQATMKMTSQLQVPAGVHSYGSQQAVRYPPQAPVVSASTYLHPNAHMYSQQMMFGQPGQILYYQPYMQGIPMPPPQQTSAALHLQTNQRGAGMPEMQVCVTPPYIPGQQPYVPPIQIPQLSNAPLPPNSMAIIRPPPQGVGGGIMPQQTGPSPGGSISKTPAIRFGGVGAST